MLPNALEQSKVEQSTTEFVVCVDYRTHTFDGIEDSFRFLHLITETREWKEAFPGDKVLELTVKKRRLPEQPSEATEEL